MKVEITPFPLTGTLPAMPSKSMMHRYLFCAALADGPSSLVCPVISEDMQASMDVLTALGASFTPTDQGFIVTPIPSPRTDHPVRLDCRESGTTCRFLLPLVAGLGLSAEITGSGRLPDRPLKDLTEALRRGGCQVSADTLPLSLSGAFTGRQVTLPGNVSSQYISAFLLMAPLLAEGLTLTIEGPLESEGYVAMTLDAMADYGVTVSCTGSTYTVPKGACYRAPETATTIEGDWSNAAFFLAAGAIGQPVTLTGLDLDSRQGDRAILDILAAFGAHVRQDNGAITVSPGHLAGISLDVSQIPDLVPILAMVAACAKGTTSFKNAGRLRLKESDRLQATASLLAGLGVSVRQGADCLQVTGSPVTSGRIQGFGDHRMVMSGAILAACAGWGPVVIDQAQAINKSYPAFFDDFAHLGGHYHVISHRP
ncbi:3-phosphoshikimate 1-carboxyvinyltransferase [Peptococcus simiae]|uniref:3-phosphoshikimate 1-carboxyvinyltransferase n=1 Tax=Peptococcus simiae TaxID=1643805 RepID=UPI00397F1944